MSIFIRLALIGTLLFAPLTHGIRAMAAPHTPRVAHTLAVLPAWAQVPTADTPPPPGTTMSGADSPTPDSPTETHAGPTRLAAGDVIEVFTNTWSYSTIGLVYDPGRNLVRYAHESQSSKHNPTIYDVGNLDHTALFSVALSTQNSTWPWQIDNRDGAGYDFSTDTYFLPDYNGDLSYSDDNIAEIKPDGTILNAWEMDDEVGSNDSGDGSEIDAIIDIAVVPGAAPGDPTRYFVTAAYDDNVIYEIELTRTGTLWTPNSWRTVATCTVPSWDANNDNLGIDYDADNEVLYHSSWDTTTVLLTDLACSNGQPLGLIHQFDCAGAGGYNSGVTYIEGSSPPEVWVTDFSSDQTTRCEVTGTATHPQAAWEKQIDGQLYDPDVPVLKETADIMTVTDIITAMEAFTLTETWNPLSLTLVGLDIFPPLAQVINGDGTLDIIGPAGPPEVTNITKWFHVEPCGWLSTTLQEDLIVEGTPGLMETRSVTVEKEPPDLWIISSTQLTEVYPGSIVSFTLHYSNTGGFENDVWISNTFPISAPFVYAEPFPDAVGPEGLWARWDVGDLAKHEAGDINVFVFISETVPHSNTLTIWDGIFDHLDRLQGETSITYHVNEELTTFDWIKLINGEPWHPGISVTHQTSETFEIVEFIDPLDNNSLNLTEIWNSEKLILLDSWEITPTDYRADVSTTDNAWRLSVSSLTSLELITVTKTFQVRPCTWTETLLWESIGVVGVTGSIIRNRPVIVNKHPPELWIASTFDTDVYSGDEPQFVLNYGNAGGYENRVMIRNSFPPEAPFVASDPWPTFGETGDLEVTWIFTEGLAKNQEGKITVTVAITEGLPPSTTVEIWDGIFNHVGEVADEAIIAYHVPQPTWEKWINGHPWEWDTGLGTVIETGDIFSVTDVISTRSAVAMVEHWNPERLTLTDYVLDAKAPGIVLSDTDFLSWEFPGGGPGTMTITKWFQVEPCTWTYTVLWEELWVEDIEWERRPVHIDKFPPDLRLESIGGGEVYAGQRVTFTLAYTNVGGYENNAWISNTFPISAPFAGATPWPDHWDEAHGLWAAWDLGGLETNAEDIIDVSIVITDTLVESTTLEIWDGIYHNQTWPITDTVRWDGSYHDKTGPVTDTVSTYTDTVSTYHVAQPPHVWTKYIDGKLWAENITYTIETSDTVEVTDVISTAGLFDLIEHWNPGKLALTDWAFDPPVGEWVRDTGVVTWHVPVDAPEVVTLTKWFQVAPCTWTATLLEEELTVQNLVMEGREVRFEKLAPALSLESEGGGEVYAGGQGRFTLIYANTGGRENDVIITNTFPISTPFAWANPNPAAVDPDGLWARWVLDAVDQDAREAIEVTVNISETLPPSTTLEVWDGLYNHVGELFSETWTPFHIAERPPITWHKWIDDQAWAPELWVTFETQDTFTVTDVVLAGQAFTVYEEWDPAHLTLLDAWAESAADNQVNSDESWLNWAVTPTAQGTFTLTKVFQVNPCTWTETLLWEDLVVDGNLLESRPVHVEKEHPILELLSEGGGQVYAGGQGHFTLIYANTGGRENDVIITNTFPMSAPLAWANPEPTAVDPDGLWARWDLGTVERDTHEIIEVAIDIFDTLPPSTTLEVWDGLYNHAGDLISETWTTFHITETPDIAWYKWSDDQAWNPDLGITFETSDTFTVTDVISAAQRFALYEEWNPAHLILQDAWDDSAATSHTEDGDGWLRWAVTPTAQGMFTLTKVFSVKPCTWTMTVLWEDLLVEDILLESRPVHIEKWAPVLQLDSEGGGDVPAGALATFTLIYTNTGGYESNAWIESIFPPEAPFTTATPAPTDAASDGTWARWNLGDLENGEHGMITVTIDITETLEPCNWITVTDWIYNHAGEAVSEIATGFHVTCTELSGVTLAVTNAGAIYTDTIVYFEADLAPDDATKPYTYTLNYGDGPTAPDTASDDPLAFNNHPFDTPGLHTVEVNAWNCDMAEPVTAVIDIDVLAYGACVEVNIDDVQSNSPVILGDPMYFTATVSGDTPITYSWDFDSDGTPEETGTGLTTVNYSFDVAKIYTVTLDITNLCPSTDTHTFPVTVSPGENFVYLPLVLRN